MTGNQPSVWPVAVVVKRGTTRWPAGPATRRPLPGPARHERPAAPSTALTAASHFTPGNDFGGCLHLRFGAETVQLVFDVFGIGSSFSIVPFLVALRERASIA